MGLFPSMPQPLRGYAHYIEAALSYYHGGPADFDVWLAWKGITNRLQELSAELKHAKALLSLPQSGGWRPISEAPRGQRETLLLTDGRAVLLGGRSWVCTGEQTPDGFWHTQSGSGWNPNFSFTPTHWQPLPPVPTDGGKQDGSASSNGATRLASQGCDTDVPRSAGGEG